MQETYSDIYWIPPSPEELEIYILLSLGKKCD